MQKIRKILRAVSEKTALPTNQPNIKVSDFGLIWRRFREYLQIKNFLKKSGSVTFLPLSSPNVMQKIRKILTNNTDLIGPRWRRSKNECWLKITLKKLLFWFSLKLSLFPRNFSSWQKCFTWRSFICSCFFHSSLHFCDE